MKCYFVVNPAAGKGKLQEGLEVNIKEACSAKNIEYEIYRTTARYDAERYVKSVCENGEGGEKRFFLCGGDGTLSEGVNGAVGYSGVGCGVIPIGTGNDFVRNFANKEKFLDVSAQIEGTLSPVDLIKYGDRYCVNMVNIGFDCKVVEYLADIKKNPVIPGKLAYVAGVLKAFMRMPGVKPTVSFEDEEGEKLDLMLICIANGAFCGGGFKSAPYIALDDGRMNVSTVRRLNRLDFARLIGSYKTGTYVNEGTVKYIDYASCGKVTVDIGEESFVCVDGELEKHRSITFGIEKGVLPFVVPKGAEMTKNPVFPALPNCRELEKRQPSGREA